MMTDFDFAGFLDTDNQKDFALSLINLFDGIISGSDEKLINEKIKNVLNNSISKDFDGLVSVLNNFDFSSETSKISLLSIINLITPNLSVSDSLDNEWKETLLLSKKTISLKIKSIFEESDLRFIAQISQWIEKDNTNAINFQKLADLFNDIKNLDEFRNGIINKYPENLSEIIEKLDNKRKKGFVQKDIVEILEKRGVGNNISVLVTQEAMSGISSHQLLTDPLIQVEINENNDPEKAFEVMEVLPEIGTLLTSTASDKNGSFLFLVLCKNKNSIQELEKLSITFKEFLQK